MGRALPDPCTLGRNPDGSWAIGLANPTGTPTVEDLNGVPTQLFDNATTLVVELVLPELAPMPAATAGGGRSAGRGVLVFVPRRSTGAESYGVEEPPVVMSGGRLSVTLGPNQLLTLRSQAPNSNHTLQKG